MQAFPLIATLLYSFTLWFGLYLLARDPQKPGLRYAGLGLVSYALGLAGATLYNMSEVGVAQTVVYVLPTILPAIFWVGATLHLFPSVSISPRLDLIIFCTALVVFGLQLLSAALPALQVAVYLVLLYLIGFACWHVGRAIHDHRPRPPLVVLLTATIFLALGVSLILLPLEWLANELVLFTISLDVIALGYAIGRLDAYEEGTTLRRDALRSLLGSSLAALVVGGQIVLVMAIIGLSPALMMLLFGVLGTLLAMLTFGDLLMQWLDELVLGYDTTITNERGKLRAMSRALSRLDETHEFTEMDDAEFARLTRRALSHYASLDKLAASPLIRHPAVDARLLDDDVEDSMLARANALKSLLREGIELLRPMEVAAFQQGDEWRYFNALYYPYVAGIRPYSQRFDPTSLDVEAAAALKWFKTHVPERTLYNWQNTAAQLVARHIRERHNQAVRV